ncbi:MAG TPA: hypothetical protein VFW33_21690 [Gemmataceae bacterium]|nr:hypothetical protein [Gemmataceae bacterium]
MSLLTFACPACGKVLKSFSPITTGTRVKCPTCGASFAMTAQDAGRAVLPADGTPPTPAGAPRRRTSRALIVGAAALLIAGLAAGLYFALSPGKALPSRHEEDPLAYLPPGTEFVAGADMPAVLDDPLFGPAVAEAIGRQPGATEFLNRCEKETGLSPRDLLGHALLAGKLDVLDGLQSALPGFPGAQVATRPAPVTIILKPTRPFDPRQVVRAVEGARRRSAHGKTYYEVEVGEMRTLYMPSDRVIVLSMLPPSELDAVFASDGTTANLSPEGVALVHGAESHPCWAVVPFDGPAGNRLRHAAAAQPGSLANTLQLATGLAVWGGADGERLHFGADAPCAGERDAVRLAADGDAAWKSHKTELAMVEMALLLRPALKRAYRELTGSVRFTTDGTTARFSAEVSRQAVSGASEELQKGQGLIDLLGGVPPKLPPGPRMSR